MISFLLKLDILPDESFFDKYNRVKVNLTEMYGLVQRRLTQD